MKERGEREIEARHYRVSPSNIRLFKWRFGEEGALGDEKITTINSSIQSCAVVRRTPGGTPDRFQRADLPASRPSGRTGDRLTERDPNHPDCSRMHMCSERVAVLADGDGAGQQQAWWLGVSASDARPLSSCRCQCSSDSVVPPGRCVTLPNSGEQSLSTKTTYRVRS